MKKRGITCQLLLQHPRRRPLRGSRAQADSWQQASRPYHKRRTPQSQWSGQSQDPQAEENNQERFMIIGLF